MYVSLVVGIRDAVLQRCWALAGCSTLGRHSLHMRCGIVSIPFTTSLANRLRPVCQSFCWNLTFALDGFSSDYDS
eukprot:3072629-Amphidinium_carterae.1